MRLVRRFFSKITYHLSFCYPHTNATSVFPGTTGASENKEKNLELPKTCRETGKPNFFTLTGFFISFPLNPTKRARGQNLSEKKKKKVHIRDTAFSEPVSFFKIYNPKCGSSPSSSLYPVHPDLPTELRSSPRN